jgi:hypothetical protein
MEYVTPRNVAKAGTAGNGVFHEVRADSYVMQQQKKWWKRCFLLGPF